MTGLLAGRRGLIFGVANDHSLAWGIARRLAAEGASLGFSYLDERLGRRVRPLAESIGAPLCAPCDLGEPAQVEAFFEAARATFETIDFLIHSVAFARREDLGGAFSAVSRAGYAQAMDLSAYTLIDLARRALPLMPAGGSVVTLTYYGAEKVVPAYGVMGPAKAALEANVRYLAQELGPREVRVNALSAGPVRTLSAAGIPGFRALHKASTHVTPLRRPVTLDDVAGAALFLVSDLARAVTGEVLHVDCGYHALAGGVSGPEDP